MRAALFFICFFSLAGFAQTDPYIRDVQNLLNSLESRDPTRVQLTLKLADAYFNEALKLSTALSQTEAQTKMMQNDQRRAIRLYQDAESGLNALFQPLNGAMRSKVEFQLARLYNDQGNSAAAEKIWTELTRQEALPDVQRESRLRLAETLEKQNSAAALNGAETHYKKALELCSSGDVCSYIHYRLAWVLERQEQLKPAIAEMKQALWDVKGQIREEALRDFVAFLAAVADDGHDALATIEKLSAKLVRPKLQTDLSDAYFARGNRKAGVFVLEAVNRKTPSLKSYVRLLEEDYGFRNWEHFDSGLEEAFNLSAKPDGDAETEKVLRRLTVQLDGERSSQPHRAEEFKKTVMLYLKLYPKRAERTQMIDGWLASETDGTAKIRQLKIWIVEEKQLANAKEELRLRKIRASVAQLSHDYQVVTEEMAAIQISDETPLKRREAAYQLAYAHYQNNDSAAALPLFQRLADVRAGTPDAWALQSEHLALDILAKKKAYGEVLGQARVWTRDPRFASWSRTLAAHAAELQDLKKVETSAEFERATTLGTNPEALTVFKRDCETDLLLPQSCANAQILAVKLADQPALIAILRKLGKKNELAAELEASGEFGQAAEMLEKNLQSAGMTSRDSLKVALLYELAGNNAARDHVLKMLMAHLSGTKSLGNEEELIYRTLKDANLLNAASIKLAWKPALREELMDRLAGNGDAPSIEKLIRTCHDTGPAWEKLAGQELRRLDERQKAIHFAGRGSKKKFQSRLVALKLLMDRGGCYLEGSTPTARAGFAILLSHSQTALAEEIKAAPVPADVDEQGRAALEKALADLAQPFVDKGLEFQKLADAQQEKVEAAADAEPKTLAVPLGRDVLKIAIAELHHNPDQRDTLERLKSYYESNGKTRLAAYFEGRLLQQGGMKQ